MHNVLLIVPQHNGDPDQNPGGQITAANGLVAYFKFIGVEARVVNTVGKSFPPPGLHRKMGKSLLRVFTVLCLLCTNRYRWAVLFSGGGLSLMERVVLCLFMRAIGVRSILFFRNSEILRVHKGTLLGVVVRIGLKAPNSIAVQGQLFKSHLEELGIKGEKLIVVRNWLPPTIRIAEKPKEPPAKGITHFVYVGRLIEAKGIYEMVEAIERLIKNRSKFKFTFVGGGTLEPWLRKQHAKLRWGELVEITGWKSSQEIEDILTANHVFVLPTYHPEGFPNALLEAFAKGLPAISTNVGAISESLFDGENGFIIPVKDSTALYEAMEKYNSTPEIITGQSLKALAVAESKHDWELNCKVVVENLAQIS